ncbi:uncharacterized protein LOC109718247 [Ananas comosus]|uniref:Uncharacterized protein LOC109718247 n=2 Tax=Ananas comosus TaxID=4615 RepID=A0A6P5G2P2_ANACO|nr:uncharacterized protein LOC109718247 [Ananas comosus]
MKPPHIPGEGSWIHEVKQAIGDKLRRLCTAAIISSPVCNSSRKGLSFEDPIRRVMFLGPWGHT